MRSPEISLQNLSTLFSLNLRPKYSSEHSVAMKSAVDLWFLVLENWEKGPWKSLKSPGIFLGSWYTNPVLGVLSTNFGVILLIYISRSYAWLKVSVFFAKLMCLILKSILYYFIQFNLSCAIWIICRYQITGSNKMFLVPTRSTKSMYFSWTI